MSTDRYTRIQMFLKVTWALCALIEQYGASLPIVQEALFVFLVDEVLG